MQLLPKSSFRTFSSPRKLPYAVCISFLFLPTTLGDNFSVFCLYKLVFSRCFVSKIEILLLFPTWGGYNSLHLFLFRKSTFLKKQSSLERTSLIFQCGIQLIFFPSFFWCTKTPKYSIFFFLKLRR